MDIVDGFMDISGRNAIIWTGFVILGLVIFTASVVGTDIGYPCTNDSACEQGNGGKYSACSKVFRVCVCTVDIRGEEAIYSTRCDDLSCTVAGFCSKSCAPKEILKWREGEDWYGNITVPFTSIFIQDKKTVICYDPDRALNSVPEGLVVKNSTIPGAGLGVITDRYIQRDTVMGPYKGIIELDTNIAVQSGYSWKIRKDSVRNQLTWVDAKYKHMSNWLRYVNMPNSENDENLVAMQHRGQMYYQAFKSIPAGTELMVHYGEEYAEFLSIDDYPPPSYYYGHKDYAGGACNSGEGGKCYNDHNGLCIDKTCICRPGSHFRYGACITDGTLGGRCFNAEGETCKNDQNAVCHRGTCVCKDNCTAVNNVCVLDEMFGGHCQGNDGEDCLRDTNAECVQGLCDCKYSTTAIYGSCIKDGTVGGRCKGRAGTRCKHDKNAQCWGGFCACKSGSSNIDGRCMLDEMVGGKCAGKDLKPCALDRNAVCVNRTCICMPETSPVGELCLQDEVYGGRCNGRNNSVCLKDTNALCRDGICVCREKSSSVDGTCKQEERLGGRCAGANGWPCKLDQKVVCLDGICQCRPGTSEARGTCILDGHLGGMCKHGECLSSNIICDTQVNKCMCRAGLKDHGGRCVKT